MIYRILRFLFQLALRQYFREISIYHAAPIPSDRPILYVANHPSALMDAFLVSTEVDRPLDFVARGESFGTPLKRWLLSFLNMHPIYRKAFTPELTHKNEGIIEGFQRILLSGKSVLIFPEGISKTEPRLRKIKTGAARIALGAFSAATDQSKLPLIVPIGLNYTNPHEFRSKVMLNFGKPISLNEYEETYMTNPRTAVKKLTKEIEESLLDLTLCIPDEELDDVVATATVVFEKELLKIDGGGEACAKKEFNVRKDLIRATHYFKEVFPSRLQDLKGHLKHYQEMLSSYEVKDVWLREEIRSSEKTLFLFSLLRLLVVFPLFLFGSLNHLPVLLLSKLVTEKVSDRPDFKGSLLVSFGLLFCLLSYTVQLLLVLYYSGSILVAGGYVFLLSLAGTVSLSYVDWLRQFKKKYHKQFLTEAKEQQIARLKIERKQLIDLLHLARVDYVKMQKGTTT